MSSSAVITNDGGGIAKVETGDGNVLFRFHSSMSDPLTPACSHMSDGGEKCTHCETLLIEAKRKAEEGPGPAQKAIGGLEPFRLPSELNMLYPLLESSIATLRPSGTGPLIIVTELDWSVKRTRSIMAPSVTALMRRSRNRMLLPSHVTRPDVSISVADDVYTFSSAMEEEETVAPGKQEEPEPMETTEPEYYFDETGKRKKKPAPRKKKPKAPKPSPLGTEDGRDRAFFETPEKYIPELFRGFQPLHILSAWMFADTTSDEPTFVGLCTYVDNIFEGTLTDYIRALLVFWSILLPKNVKGLNELSLMVHKAVMANNANSPEFEANVRIFIRNSLESRELEEAAAKELENDGTTRVVLVARHVTLQYEKGGADFSAQMFRFFPNQEDRVLSFLETRTPAYPEARIYHLLVEPRFQSSGIDSLFLETVQAKLVRHAHLERVTDARLYGLDYSRGLHERFKFGETKHVQLVGSENLVKNPFETSVKKRIVFSQSFESTLAKPEVQNHLDSKARDNQEPLFKQLALGAAQAEEVSLEYDNSAPIQIAQEGDLIELFSGKKPKRPEERGAPIDDWRLKAETSVMDLRGMNFKVITLKQGCVLYRGLPNSNRPSVSLSEGASYFGSFAVANGYAQADPKVPNKLEATRGLIRSYVCTREVALLDLSDIGTVLNLIAMVNDPSFTRDLNEAFRFDTNRPYAPLSDRTFRVSTYALDGRIADRLCKMDWLRNAGVSPGWAYYQFSNFHGEVVMCSAAENLRYLQGVFRQLPGDQLARHVWMHAEGTIVRAQVINRVEWSDLEQKAFSMHVKDVPEDTKRVPWYRIGTAWTFANSLVPFDFDAVPEHRWFLSVDAESVSVPSVYFVGVYAKTDLSRSERDRLMVLAKKPISSLKGDKMNEAVNTLSSDGLSVFAVNSKSGDGNGVLLSHYIRHPYVKGRQPDDPSSQVLVSPGRFLGLEFRWKREVTFDVIGRIYENLRAQTSVADVYLQM